MLTLTTENNHVYKIDHMSNLEYICNIINNHYFKNSDKFNAIVHTGLLNIGGESAFFIESIKSQDSPRQYILKMIKVRYIDDTDKSKGQYIGFQPICERNSVQACKNVIKYLPSNFYSEMLAIDKLVHTYNRDSMDSYISNNPTIFDSRCLATSEVFKHAFYFLKY